MSAFAKPTPSPDPRARNPQFARTLPFGSIGVEPEPGAPPESAAQELTAATVRARDPVPAADAEFDSECPTPHWPGAATPRIPFAELQALPTPRVRLSDVQPQRARSTDLGVTQAPTLKVPPLDPLHAAPTIRVGVDARQLVPAPTLPVQASPAAQPAATLPAAPAPRMPTVPIAVSATQTAHIPAPRELQVALQGGAGARPHAPAAATASKQPVFRERALRARREDGPIASLPQVTGSRWAVLGFLMTAVAALLVVGYVGRVEVTSIAQGALVVRGGPRPVLTQASGQVLELEVKAGERVSAGQEIACIDATELLAREQREREQLSLTRAQHERLSAENATLYDNTVAALQRKRALLAQRSNLKTLVAKDRHKHASQLDTLAREGAASQTDALVARDSARSSQEELLVLRQQIADIDLELSDRKRSFESEQETLARQLKEAVASLDEAHSLVELTRVRAPVSGRVESLLVTAGQVVASGAAVARIVPDGSLTSVVVFAPAKDAAFLRAGLSANVEFASLPVSEFGKASARVTRVSNDVATREEVSTVLGVVSEEPVIRVELDLLPSPVLTKVSGRLRSGERLTARLNTRERRIITLLFDFLRKWYPT